MKSNGHHKHDNLCVGRSTPKAAKSTMWIAISFANRRILCCMTKEQVPVYRGYAIIVGVGLRKAFPRKETPWLRALKFRN
jgi:hypothetical protein